MSHRARSYSFSASLLCSLLLCAACDHPADRDAQVVQAQESQALEREPADYAAPTPRLKQQLIRQLSPKSAKFSPLPQEITKVTDCDLGSVKANVAKLETCDGTATGLSVTRVGYDWTVPIPLAQQDIGVLELEGCFPSDTSFAWSTSSGATIIGNDVRVNLATESASSLTLQGCATVGTGTPSCSNTTVTLPAARARVQVSTLSVLADYGYGKVRRIQGNVANAPSGSRVWVFKHSDVHYYDSTSVSIGSGGNFSVDIFAMNNVDRFVVTLVDSSLSLASHSGCNSSWCFGETDPLTGQNVPLAADRSTIFDFDVKYLLPSTGASDPQVEALRGLFSPSSVSGSLQPAVLVRTDWESKRYFLYDQALAAMAFTYAGDQASAQKVLNALADLQLSNGSWYFMYNANGTSPFPASGDYRYTGAVAWAVMAFNVYHHAYSGLTYASTVNAALAYLDGLRGTVGSTTAVRFNPTNLSATSWNETNVYAFEHNADAYAAFLGAAENAGSNSYPTATADLKTFLTDRWNGSYFRPGVDTGWGENTTDVYLDPMTWGVLALGADAAPYYAGLDYACDHFVDPAGYLGANANIVSFFDYQRADGTIPYGPFGWLEGSLGAITALQQAERDSGLPYACHGMYASDLFDSVAQLEGFHGGGTLPEATLNEDPDYDSAPSAAATAWFYFAKHEHNPFRPWEE